MEAKKKGYTVDNCPRSGPYRYEKRYENFITGMYDPCYFFKAWDMFTAFKVVLHTLAQHGVWEQFMRELDGHAEYLHPRMNNEAFAANAHALVLEWTKAQAAHDPVLAKGCL